MWDKRPLDLERRPWLSSFFWAPIGKPYLHNLYIFPHLHLEMTWTTMYILYTVLTYIRTNVAMEDS